MDYINKNKRRIVEGKLRCEELAAYLNKIKAPKTVWLSEDASGIMPKICYDSTTNQMVGLVLPLDEQSMPILYSYKPKSIQDIELFSKAQKSTQIYIVMAQPIKPNTPPFILQMFGVDMTFTALNVAQRWEYTKRELQK